MKRPCSLSLAVALIVVGCNDQSGSTSSTQTNSTDSSTTVSGVVSAPVDYLGALGRGQQSATKTVDVTSLNSAIQLFQVEKGRNPRDLNELVQEKYIPMVPKPPYGMRIDYDPATGQVTVVKQ